MNRNLSWFIGPKAENSLLFKNLLELIVQDYFHWRKNYFPKDQLLITKDDQRSFEKEHDKMYQNVHEFLASLRRNFPFYNPRYIAHMLSDTSIPSMLGYFGGMLYNPNNVTPEAAPVTTEWEIQACNDIMKMLGYIPSPTPPPEKATIEDWKKYQKESSSEFGWSHITSGGTVANIEALWVARCVKYLPLSIQEVCKPENKDIRIEVKMPNGETKDISEIKGIELINIKPNESIYMLSKYIKAYTRKYHPKGDINSASKEAMQTLSNAKYSLSNNMGLLLNDYPLKIFVSGTAHYSMNKAADLLGIGRNNIEIIDIGADFRIKKSDLETKINNAIEKGFSPLAVIGIAGTTEEGAIDPIYDIVDVRKDYEKKNISFWFHIDSAWGGYVKTILEIGLEGECRIIANKINSIITRNEKKYYDTKECLENISIYCDNYIQKQVNDIFDSDPKFFYAKFSNSNIALDNIQGDYLNILGKIHRSIESKEKDRNIQTKIQEKEKIQPIYNLLVSKNKISQTINSINEAIGLQDFNKAIDLLRNYLRNLTSIIVPIQKSENGTNKKELQITSKDRAKDMSFYVSTEVEISYKSYNKKHSISVYNENLVKSFLAFRESDSITIDPHKLGYIPYPCGVVAFKNDRIRHLIIQEAPYITSSTQNALLHNPPLHVNNVDFDKLTDENLPYDKYTVGIEAFAPFILEGSKPGAAASSLWLTNKCIPLTRDGHGSIIRNSLLATKELYTWMIRWKDILKEVKEDTDYEFLPVSGFIPPDLNVFVFTVKSKKYSSLQEMNTLTKMVYDKFSIQVELGDKKYSYSQPFFLSKSPCKCPNYNFEAFSDFFNNKKNNFNVSKEDYEKEGLLVLRATLMNPYIYAYEKYKNVNLIEDFMTNLHRAANELVAKLHKELDKRNVESQSEV